MGIMTLLGVLYQEYSPIHDALCGYIIALCLLSVLVELNLTSLATKSMILTNWVTRGAFYVLIGIMGLQEGPDDVVGESKMRENVVVLFEGIAYTMIALGCLYFCMGLLCLQLLYNKMAKNYKKRVLTSKEKKLVQKKQDVV